jgi:hypothetical protein
MGAFSQKSNVSIGFSGLGIYIMNIYQMNGLMEPNGNSAKEGGL